MSDFPIPSDLTGFWLWDRVHCPRPVAPLEYELLVSITGKGFSNAIGELGSTLLAASRSINYYNYIGPVVRDLGGEDRSARAARYKKNVAELLPKLGERWEKEWLPGMLPALERSRRTDYVKLSDAELLGTFDQMRSEVVERWSVHGMLLYAFFAAGQFADFYKEATGTANEQEGYEALQGFPSIGLESTRCLWRLSRRVHSNQELRRLFETTPADRLLGKLQGSTRGREFVRELNVYLDEYGWRTDSIYELTKPAWREDPRIPLGTIKGYLTVGDEGSPDVVYDQAVRRREQLLVEARKKIAGDTAMLRRFNEIYDAASHCMPVIEDHNHWIDQMGDIVMRYPSLELGRRLVGKGSIDGVDDVFMLQVAEIQEGVRTGKSFGSIVSERRRDMERFAGVMPPPVIGDPVFYGDPIEDVLGRFFGVPVKASEDTSVINGVGASPGTARGPAKIVRTLEEASKLQKGDVMVCEMTLPPWTPLFSTVSAVVADTGGILCHCAIVARECQLPCVVGTMIGTATLKDGQIVTVDGTRGVVRIEG